MDREQGDPAGGPGHVLVSVGLDPLGELEVGEEALEARGAGGELANRGQSRPPGRASWRTRSEAVPVLAAGHQQHHLLGGVEGGQMCMTSRKRVDAHAPGSGRLEAAAAARGFLAPPISLQTRDADGVPHPLKNGRIARCHASSSRGLWRTGRTTARP